MITEKQKTKSFAQVLLNFFKKYKIIIISLAAVIAAALVVESIITGMQEKKVMAFLEGKIFIEDLYSVSGGKGSKRVICINGGKVSVEKWYDVFDEPEGNIDHFADCRIKAGIFSDDIAIQEKYGNHWSTVQLVALCDDDTVVNYTYSSDSPVWREITKEELQQERAAYFCGEHKFTDWVTISNATCSHSGEKSRTCSKCGYLETQRTEKLDHKYKDKICTVCGAEKQPEKSTITANTWYSYKDVLQVQNCLVKAAFSTGGGLSMTVQYYAVCQQCHTIDETSKLSAPEVGYDVERIHTCEECGAYTTVKLRID